MSPDAPIQPTRQASGILGYDLGAPVQPLLPAWTPLRYDPAEMAANARRDEAERRRTEVRVAQEAATALEQWRAFREQYADNPIVTAVLDIHQPETGYDTVVCSECEEHNGYEDTQQVTWPCRTYDAMRAAAETSKNERSASA